MRNDAIVMKFVLIGFLSVIAVMVFGILGLFVFLACIFGLLYSVLRKS